MIKVVITVEGDEEAVSMHQSDRQTLNRIHSELHEVRLGIAALRDDLSRMEQSNMATKQEVQADIDELKQVVGETRGVAKSIIALVEKLLTQITNAAASAADLDEFRASLALIKTETMAEKDEIAAEVAKNP